jgi:hypothetical protein
MTTSLFYILFIVFCFLSIVDLATTYTILKQGGKEVNPVYVWMAKQIPLDVALPVLKMLAVVLLAISGSIPAAVVGIAATAAVVGWNLTQIKW